MLSIRLPAEVEERLAALAKATGCTKTFYARKAILEYLGDIEGLYLAEQRLIDIRAGRSGTGQLEEVMVGEALKGDRLGFFWNYRVGDIFLNMRRHPTSYGHVP